MKKAVILLSGGLDSAVLLAMALRLGRECYPVALDYGQRSQTAEWECARSIVHYYAANGAPIYTLRTVTIGGLGLSSSSLMGFAPLPVLRTPTQIAAELLSTYVPGRNSILMSVAAALAEDVCAEEIWLGVTSLAGARGGEYPDASDAYLSAFTGALALGTRCKPIELWAPLRDLDKFSVVLRGKALGVPMHLTRSCYDYWLVPCRVCDACVLRAAAFQRAGMLDFAAYR